MLNFPFDQRRWSREKEKAIDAIFQLAEEKEKEANPDLLRHWQQDQPADPTNFYIEAIGHGSYVATRELAKLTKNPKHLYLELEKEFDIRGHEFDPWGHLKDSFTFESSIRKLHGLFLQSRVSRAVTSEEFFYFAHYLEHSGQLDLANNYYDRAAMMGSTLAVIHCLAQYRGTTTHRRLRYIRQALHFDLPSAQEELDDYLRRLQGLEASSEEGQLC